MTIAAGNESSDDRAPGVSTPNTLLVHIGLPKAGSTWLQRQVFDNRELGFISPWGQQSIVTLEQVRARDSFVFDQEIEDHQKVYSEGVTAARAAGLTPVASHECLVVDPIGGAFPIRESTRRIAKLFPTSKIFMLIREQKAIMLSSYMEHLRRGFTTTLERFLGFDAQGRLGYVGVCPRESLLYDNLIGHLHEVFGRDRVLVLPMEMIQDGTILPHLLSFVGRSMDDPGQYVNSSPERHHRKSDYVFLRFLNRFGQSRSVNKDGDTPLRKAAYGANIALNYVTPKFAYNTQRKKLQDKIAEFVGEYYLESNTRASQLIGVNLRDYGYPARDVAAVAEGRQERKASDEK
jgi:hypothetical protein